MFARMFNSEPEGYADAITQGADKLSQYFSKTLPDIIYSRDKDFPADKVSATTNQFGTKNVPVIRNEQLKMGIDVDLLNRRQAECEGSGISDQFQHLSNLANSQDPYTAARCGWVHNTVNPQQGRGAYGIAEGPFNTTAKGVWKWDLKEAKKLVHTDLCRQVRDCTDIDAAPYSGRCGYCTTSGKAVPIENGRVAYPYEPNLNCAGNSLVTGGASCPKPVPLPPGAPEPANVSPCDPLPGGNLRRSCLIEKVRQAGCSDNGALATALSKGSDTNYTDALAQSRAFQIYQTRASVPIDATSMRQGRLTTSQALSEFKRVSDQAASGANTGLAFAARDLCISAGEVEKFDFCTELSDATLPPFDIACLQKEFLRAGGQKTGASYPSLTNLGSVWNAERNWGAVKQRIQKMREDTMSGDRLIQEPAIGQFLGIPLENKTKPNLPAVAGCEVFWFTHDWDVNTPTIFLGRRIRPTPPDINQSVDLKGTQGHWNNFEMISFVYICNLKVPNDTNIQIRATGDDGFTHTLNRPLTDLRNNKIASGANELTNLGYFPPTTATNNTCWTLSATKPNIMMGYWFNGCCGFYYKFEYRPNCANGQSSATWSTLPASMVNLTKEPFAPMVEFGVGRNAFEFGARANFFDKRMSSYKMQWVTDLASPIFNYAPPGSRDAKFPLGRSYMTVNPGMGISTQFRFKMYSFQTLTVLCSFNSVPGSKASIAANLHIWSPTSNVTTQIRIIGTGDYKSGELVLHDSNFGSLSNNLRVETDVPYLVTLRVLRKDPTDIFSVYGIQLGCAKLADLQKDGKSLRETNAMVFANPRSFDNPNSKDARIFSIRGDTSWNVYSINMFDYNMDSTALQREALGDWLSFYN